MSKRPTILVTGGAGYIGSHCCRALDAAGYQPVTYDNLSTGHRSFAAGALVVGDIADKATLARTFAEHEIVAVMHFAASSLVGESVADPQKYYVNNLAGTLSLLETMREAGCNRLVFSSTGAVYGNADSKALREDYPCAPINPYGASKWMIERVLADYRAAYGFGSFALRYFNAAGADPAGGIGELREVETHLIPRAMMALQGHVPDFAVFGDDYDTPDGTAIRDYIHVTDLAAAHVLALKLLLEGHSGGAFNLGTGNGFSVREILAAIAAETGREVPACRQAAATRRSDLSGRRSLRRTHDIELPSRAFRSGHDHPHRLGVAQEGAPAEDRRAGSRVRRGNLPAPQHPQSLCGNTPTPTLPRKRERESDALRKRSLGGL